MQQVSKIRSPLRYPGGKQKAIQQIAKMLPSQVGEYREPMVGGGSVYLHAKSSGMARRYWINDKFQELAAFWMVSQDEKLCRKMVEELTRLHGSFTTGAQIKSYFQKARLEQPKDKYRQALLFFFFNRVTFSGTTRAGGFSSAASLGRFTESSIIRLASLPEALDGTKITNVDYADVIKKPGKDVFLFLDPPYYMSANLYGRNGSLHEFDHERLAHLLKESGHRFLITYDDCSDVRRLYSKWAKIKTWKLQYGMNNCNHEKLSKIGSELFIYNY